MAETIRGSASPCSSGAPDLPATAAKKAERHELSSLRFAVSGAEKMPMNFTMPERRFWNRAFASYGLTETTPVTNVNMPEPVKKGARGGGHGATVGLCGPDACRA